MTSECPVCLTEKRLVVTTCKSKHSFCADCLQTLVRQHGASFPCPVCRQTVSIPNGRVSRLLHHQLDSAAAGDWPAGAVVPEAESDPGDGRDAGRRNRQHFHVHMLLYRPHGANVGRRAGPPLSPSSHQRDSGGRNNRQPPFQREALSEDSEVDRLGTQTGRPRNPAEPYRRPGAVPRGAANNARTFGPSVGRDPHSGGPLEQLSEDEQMAFALQEAEFQTTRSFRRQAGRFGPSPVHGRLVEKDDAFSPPEPSQPSRRRPSFFPSRAGNRRVGHDSSLSLAADSDEGLALRLQEEEIRRASERAREQRLTLGALDEDDLFAQRLQEEEIRAARRQEKDRQVAQRYQQGRTDRQGLVNGLQRIDLFDHTVGDHQAGATSVERREEVTGPGEPDANDSSPNSPSGDRSMFETSKTEGPTKFEFFSFTENTGNDGFFDTSESDGHSKLECFDVTDHAENGERPFFYTSEHDGPSKLGCNNTAEHVAETGERKVFDNSEHDAAGERTLFDTTSFTYDTSGDSSTPETPGEWTFSDRGGLDARIGSTFSSSGERGTGPGERNNLCVVEELNSNDEGDICDSRLSVVNASRLSVVNTSRLRLSNAAAERRQAEEEHQLEGEKCEKKKKKKMKKKKTNRRVGRGGSGGDRGSACGTPQQDT